MARIIYAHDDKRIQFEGGRPILPESPDQELTTMTSVNPLLPVAPAEEHLRHRTEEASG